METDMTEPAAVHSTFVIERTYPKPAATVFAALADPTKKQRWFAESDQHEVQEFESDGLRDRPSLPEPQWLRPSSRFGPGTRQQRSRSEEQAK